MNCTNWWTSSLKKCCRNSALKRFFVNMTRVHFCVQYYQICQTLMCVKGSETSASTEAGWQPVEMVEQADIQIQSITDRTWPWRQSTDGTDYRNTNHADPTQSTVTRRKPLRGIHAINLNYHVLFYLSIINSYTTQGKHENKKRKEKKR